VRGSRPTGLEPATCRLRIDCSRGLASVLSRQLPVRGLTAPLSYEREPRTETLVRNTRPRLTVGGFLLKWGCSYSPRLAVDPTKFRKTNGCYEQPGVLCSNVNRKCGMFSLAGRSGETLAH